MEKNNAKAWLSLAMIFALCLCIGGESIAATLRVGSSGEDVKTLQTNLGHSNISTTLDVYAHVTQKLKADSADKLEKFVSGLQKQG